MLTAQLSIGLSNTELSLRSEQTAGEKCSCAITNALQLMVIRMSTHTPHHKRDYGVEPRQTVENETSATYVTMLTGVVG